MSRAAKYNRTKLHPANMGYKGFKAKTEKKWYKNYFKTKKMVLAEQSMELFDFLDDVQAVI